MQNQTVAQKIVWVALTVLVALLFAVATIIPKPYIEMGNVWVKSYGNGILIGVLIGGILAFAVGVIAIVVRGDTSDL